jgi:hypothetical protein
MKVGPLSWRGTSSAEDGGNSLQIWRVAANILNKQLWTADKGWSCSLGFRYSYGSNNSLQKTSCYNMFTGPQTWMHSLEWPKQRKTDMRSGRAGSLTAVARELAKHKLDLVGVHKVMQQGWHWTSRQLYILLWKWEWESCTRDGIFCT